MKRVISFVIFAIAFALLISCRSTNSCTSIDKKEFNPTITEVTLHQTEVA